MEKLKTEKTEVEILNAAKKILQQKEIADEAGINKAILHYYFRSKEMLFEAVFKSAISLLAAELNAILNDDSSVEDKIKNSKIFSKAYEK